MRGVDAFTTTYGVGALGASAVAGAYAERLPVLHLTGMPNRSAQADLVLELVERDLNKHAPAGQLYHLP